MPDSRSNRGAHPEDPKCFSVAEIGKLRDATFDLSWLLEHGYPTKASAELVGNRYALRERQRKAMQRCSVGETRRSTRCMRRVEPVDVAGAQLEIDGYNLVLTIEAALAGGVILAARDGTYRDLAAMSGHYKKVLQTDRALRLIGGYLEGLEPRSIRWLFDRPVSNSGRLKGIMEALASQQEWSWIVELVPNPDPVLECSSEIVVSADSGILDRGPRWLNLARHVIDERIPDAWIVDLSSTDPAAPE